MENIKYISYFIISCGYGLVRLLHSQSSLLISVFSLLWYIEFRSGKVGKYHQNSTTKVEHLLMLKI